MTSEQTETFLTVASCGNITEAAHALCISQGAVSMRIQQLERELGIVLFDRQRGVKTVALTPEGECLRTLAKQWRSLDQQAHEIKNLLSYRELRLAAVDTFNTYLFTDLYVSHIERHPRTRLYIQTEHSTEIHQLIASQEIDIGFAYTLHPSNDIISRPIFQEGMEILCRRDSRFAETHDTRDLSDAREIRARYSTEMSAWHHRRFPHARTRLTTIGTHSMLPNIMRLPDTWGIVAASVGARIAQAHSDLVSVPFDHDAPPMRTAYYLSYRHPRPWVQELSDVFLDDVMKLVDESPQLLPLS